MNSIIRFAGIGLNWTSHYAVAYAKYLGEIGFAAKVIGNDKCLVAYAHRHFSGIEIESALTLLREGDSVKTSETSS